MQSCTMSEHCFCMQTYWRGLEGGQSEWGFEFDLDLLLEQCFMQDLFQNDLFMKSQSVGWQRAACFKEGTPFCVGWSPTHYRRAGEQPTFERGSFFGLRFFFPSFVGVIEIIYSYLSNTRPHIRVYVVCKCSGGEWTAYERGDIPASVSAQKGCKMLLEGVWVLGLLLDFLLVWIALSSTLMHLQTFLAQSLSWFYFMELSSHSVCYSSVIRRFVHKKIVFIGFTLLGFIVFWHWFYASQLGLCSNVSACVDGGIPYCLTDAEFCLMT
ncbi:hypothetical protein PS2_042350 [Malus domestica]